MSTEDRTADTLRQRMWGIYIKPYFAVSADNIVHRGGAYAQSPLQGGSYTSLQGGDLWMLHDTDTSFTLIREKVKEIMDELGYSKHDICVAELIPFDHVVTPLT